MIEYSVVISTSKNPQNTEKIIDILNSLPNSPKDITIWYNYPGDGYETIDFKKYKTVYSNYNYGKIGKYLYGLLLDTEYILFLDDNCIIGNKYVDNCIKSMEKCPGVYGVNGFILDNTFSQNNSIRIGGSSTNMLLNDIAQVDYVNDAIFLKKDWLNSLFRESIPNEEILDFYISYVINKYANVNSYVVPQNLQDKDTLVIIDAEENYDYNEEKTEFIKSKIPNWIPVYERIMALSNEITVETLVKPEYSIIIPTYNHLDDLLKPCIESLITYTDLTKCEIIVVANGCNDGTQQYVESLGSPFKLLSYNEPLGYTKATNIGAMNAIGDYLIFLNNDVTFINQEKGSWIKRLHEPFNNSDNVGITAAKVNFCDITHQPFALFFLAMMERSLFNELNGLDEIFNPGFAEDIDISIKAQKRGKKIVEISNWLDSEHYSSDYPICHKAEGTLHDTSYIDKHYAVTERNKLILDYRYNNTNNQKNIVNIITPTFLRYEELKELLNDIQEQTYRNIVVWVCSDGLDFKTKQIVKSYSDNSQDIKFNYVFVEPHMGCWGSYSRKLVLNIIPENGYVCFVDDDNRINNNYIEKMFNAVNKDYKPMAYCNVTVYNKFDYNGAVIPNEDVNNNFQQGRIDSLNVIIRNDIAKKCAIHWDENYAHDFYFIRACSILAKESIYIPDILGEHRFIDEKPNLDYIVNKLGKYKDLHPELFNEIIVQNSYKISSDEVKGKNILDLGANRGFFSMFALELGAGYAMCVEANPRIFKLLKSNMDSYSEKSICLNFAVFDDSLDYVILQDCENDVETKIDKNGDIKAETRTIKQLLKSIPNGDIILKVDIEGSEYEAFKDLSREEMKRFSHILIEIHGEPVREANPKELEHFIINKGFNIDEVGQFYFNYIDNEGNITNTEYRDIFVYKFSRAE